MSADLAEVQGIPAVSVSEFVDILNQTYEYALSGIVISGELANLKVSKNKWVYFDLKDETASVKFFATIYQLPGPLENGMMMYVRGTPKMHPLYGFSVTVQTMQPAGEGSIRRAADLLSAKLEQEGLFDAARKRTIPFPPDHIGLITSSQSAAYGDFIKILGARWGGVHIDLVDVQVQGEAAPGQIVAALDRLNALASPPEVIVLTRGGGSADDLAAWSSEQVVRAVAASRVPTLAAIGHEMDISLSELAADRRASTPSNAAEMLVPDRSVTRKNLIAAAESLYDSVQDQIFAARESLRLRSKNMTLAVDEKLQSQMTRLAQTRQLLEVLSPRAALRRGYAIVRTSEHKLIRRADALKRGDIVRIELSSARLTAEIKDINGA